jgi:hypothetical protein
MFPWSRTLYGTWQLAKDSTKYLAIQISTSTLNRNLPDALIGKRLS